MNARPPSDPGAEKRLITACSLAPDLWTAALPVRPSDFYDLDRRRAWEQLSAACRSGAVVISGDYFAHWCDDYVLLSGHVANDGLRVMEMRYRRDALDAAQKLASAALTGEGLPEAVKGAGEIRPAVTTGTLRPAGSAIPEVRLQLEDPDAMARRVLATPYDNLNKALGGGFERQTSTVIMARPSMGKTALMVQLADVLSEAGSVVAVFSKEMSQQQWERRMACRRARANWNAIKDGTASQDDFGRLAQELYTVEGRGTVLFIDEKTPQTTDEAWRECERLKDRTGRLDFILADHLRLFSDRADNETHRLGRVSWAFKQMAKNLDCAVIVAAQLSRAVEGQADKRPDLKDLRDSGEIEENADNVIALYRDAYYNQGAEDVAELIMRKARDGERNGSAHFIFKAAWMGFERMATNDTPRAQAPAYANRNGRGTARPVAAGARGDD